MFGALRVGRLLKNDRLKFMFIIFAIDNAMLNGSIKKTVLVKIIRLGRVDILITEERTGKYKERKHLCEIPMLAEIVMELRLS